jgi:cytochrome P450
LLQEIEAAAGAEPIAAAHLNRLPLCRQALQESMRLYPPAPAIARQPRHEIELGDRRITAATQVVVPIYAVHRHAQLWDDPSEFDLDRFAPARAKARPRCAYLPFGAGPRVCIGATFAMLEATVILATLLRAFTFRTVPRHRPRPVARVTLRPRGGMPLIVAPRGASAAELARPFALSVMPP